MKSPMTQILMITLAIVFATALTVTITLLCISYIGRIPSDLFPTESRPALTTEPYRTQEPTSQLESIPHFSLPTPETTDTNTHTVSSSTEDLQKDPITPHSLLSFSSNGNGTCTVTGIGESRDVCVTIPAFSPAGERVTAIAPRAFYGCTFLTAVQIPASVQSIGEGAFSACPGLVYISVSEANLYYCDLEGVLYSADLYTLHLYPPMRAGNHTTIHTATGEILSMAFYNCAYLSHVDYEGSAEDWERIDIGSKNHSLTAASKSFSKK